MARVPVMAGRLCLASILLAFAQSAFAWRCQSRLIEPGQSRFEVNEKCGDPETSERRTEWRLQTVFQPQCQTVYETLPIPSAERGARGNQTPQVMPRTLCTQIPVSYSVPVEIETWYYEDSSVPKALHFENGRLIWIESLWHLRH